MHVLNRFLTIEPLCLIIVAMNLLLYLRNVPVTLFVMGISVANYIRIAMNGGSMETAVDCGCFDRTRIEGGDWWRFFTTGFVHISFFHLAMNLYSLYVMSSLELYFGHIWFSVILFGGIIMGSLFQYKFSDCYISVGLSGGLYALMTAELMIYFLLGYFSSTSMIYSVLRIVIINALINFMPGVGRQAHLGGAVFGAVMGLLIYFCR